MLTHKRNVNVLTHHVLFNRKGKYLYILHRIFFSPNKIAKDVNDDISYLEVTEGDSREKRKKKRMSKNKVEIKQERKFNQKVLEEKKNSIS